MKIGERIRELRFEKRIKQMDLAEAIGVTKLTLGCYERGTTKITLEAINKIAEAFNMNTLEFLKPVYQDNYTKAINNNCRVKDKQEENISILEVEIGEYSVANYLQKILVHLDLETLYNNDNDIENLEKNVVNTIKYESYKKINNL